MQIQSLAVPAARRTASISMFALAGLDGLHLIAEGNRGKTMSTRASDWLREIRERHPLRNPYLEVRNGMSGLDRLAVWITEQVGTMGFFLIIFAWTLLWLGWNLLAPARLQFDPPMGFVFWLFISNLIQILLMPLIMVGQNIQGRHAEARAEHDLEVNVKAEREIEMILHHLERQNDMLIAMQVKLGVKIDEVLQTKE
jgi:uncharacterized membrane protein